MVEEPRELPVLVPIGVEFLESEGTSGELLRELAF